jgi:hypothetical protein
MRVYYSTSVFGTDVATNVLAALAYGFGADALSRTLTNTVPPGPASTPSTVK